MTQRMTVPMLPEDEPEPSPRLREIYDAAARIFHEKGYQATSIQDVADAVGILKGSLYYYINSKQDLLFRIIDEVHRESLRSLAEWQSIDGDALVKLRAFVEGHLTSNVRNLVKIGVFFHDFRSLDGEHRERIVKERDLYDSFLRDLLVQGQKEGVVDDRVDPKMVSMAILGMLNWIYQWWRDDGANTPEQVAREFSNLVLVGIVARDDVDRDAVGAFPEEVARAIGLRAGSPPTTGAGRGDAPGN